jgi:hypothetical protein
VRVVEPLMLTAGERTGITPSPASGRGQG